MATVTSSLDEDQRWDALANRRAEATDAFIYAVRTTGVYCRPGCSSRLPRRENVEFFNTSSEAEQAGYRACKRCHPRSPLLQDHRIARVIAACRSIEASDAPLTLEKLAADAGLSGSRFHRIFSELTGTTPKQYSDEIKAIRVRAKLSDSASVTSAIYSAGFNSSSRFYEKWAWILGMKPAAYGDAGAGELILHATVKTRLGWMLVATTRVGVCSIALADDKNELNDDLNARFHKATVVAGDTSFENWVKDIASLIDTPNRFADLPLDIQGTVFMRRVWSALREIPAGQTRSYTEIAESIGDPSAVRAVASACAKNSLAVVIPCHRVVRSDGSLGGYRWGLERKRTLLQNESNDDHQ